MSHRHRHWTVWVVAVGILLVAFAALAVWLTTSWRPVSSRVRIGNIHIAYGEEATVLSRLNVHASRKPFVEVDGRVFSGVTGLPPHYYNVDSIHKVIFATSDAPRYATTIIYVVDSESGEMIQIPTTGAFGEYLGVPIAVSPDYQDFVSKATPGAVEFTAFRGSEKYVFTIDLITRQVVDAHAEPLSRMEIDSHAREKKK